MFIKIEHWEYFSLLDLGIDFFELLDTAPAPDSVFSDFASRELLIACNVFHAFAEAWLSGIDRGIFFRYDSGPESWQLLDTAPVPDSVFSNFAALEISLVPRYPADRIFDPGVTVFAGDMGAYIG